MSSYSYSDSAQHRRRLVDEWRIEQAWRLLWRELARVVADADRALHDATATLRRDEAERTAQAMVGGTGGPRDDEPTGPDDNNGGMWTETCSMCDGTGGYTYYACGMRYRAHCATCGGTGRITYRSAQRVQADADAAAQAEAAGQATPDSTLDFVRRYRASQAFTPEQRARYREMRALYEAGHYYTAEDR